MALPNQQLTSRSSSTHDRVSGTVMLSTLLVILQISVGVENEMPLALAQAGSALMKSRMLEESGWAIPKADNSMKMLIICSSSGSDAIRSI